MVLPAILATLTKAFTSAFRYRMQFTLFWQERMSEIGMGLFILTQARDYNIRLDFLSLMDKLIKAYIMLLNPVFLYVKFGEEIVNNKLLHRYFYQFKSYRVWLNYYKSTGKTHANKIINLQVIESWKKFLKVFADLMDIDQWLENPIQMVTDLFRDIQQKLEIQQIDAEKLANYILQNVLDPADNVEDLLISPNEVYLIHPTIDIDWAVIKTYIMLYFAYANFFEVDEEREVGRYHLWKGTRHVWVKYTENGITTYKLIKGGWEERKPTTIIPPPHAVSQIFETYGEWQQDEFFPKSSRHTLKIKTKDIENATKGINVPEIEIFVEHEGILSNIIKIPNLALLKNLEPLDKDFINAFYNIILIITDHMICENIYYGTYDHQIPLYQLKNKYLKIDTDKIKCFIINANEIEKASPYTKVFAILIKLQGKHYTVFAVPKNQLRVPDYISQYNVNCSLICTPCPERGPYNLAIGETTTLTNSKLDNCNQKRYLVDITSETDVFTVLSIAINKIVYDFLI